MKAFRPDPPAFLWCGFRHEWQYNHRLNRLGSYVRHVSRDSKNFTAEGSVGHPAASGSGSDTAHIVDYYTELKAQGVWCKPGNVTISIRSAEETPGFIQRPVRVELDEPMQNRDNYAVIINGFDLCSNRDADKLYNFSLCATSPVLSAKGTFVDFTIQGLLNVDCDTLECDGFPTWELVAALAVPNPVTLAALGINLAGKFNISVDYTLRVHYLLIAGDSEYLNVVHSDLFENAYNWDEKNEIFRRGKGIRPVTITGPNVWSSKESTSTLAFNHLSVVLSRTKGLLNADEAMHLLEWDMAIRKIEAGADRVTANLLMFFKNWAEGMGQAVPVPVIGGLLTHRDAGSARFGARLTLLQFKEAEHLTQKWPERQVSWDTGNKDVCMNDAKTRNEQPIHISCIT